MMSVHEPTWSKLEHKHVCCGSTHSYHKTWCPSKKISNVPGRLSDPEYIRVQELKADGKNSSEIAQELGLALEHVNELYPS